MGTSLTKSDLAPYLTKDEDTKMRHVFRGEMQELVNKIFEEFKSFKDSLHEISLSVKENEINVKNHMTKEEEDREATIDALKAISKSLNKKVEWDHFKWIVAGICLTVIIITGMFVTAGIFAFNHLDERITYIEEL